MRRRTANRLSRSAGHDANVAHSVSHRRRGWPFAFNASEAAAEITGGSRIESKTW
jgi:hypothetical protein